MDTKEISNAARNETAWFVYMVEAADGSLYTGVSTDVDRRLAEHESGIRGARYLRGRGPLRLVWQEGGHDRSSALKREWAIKALPRPAKLALIQGADEHKV